MNNNENPLPKQTSESDGVENKLPIVDYWNEISISNFNQQWMTLHIESLIQQRQVLYKNNQKEEWLTTAKQVKNLINKRKKALQRQQNVVEERTTIRRQSN